MRRYSVSAAMEEVMDNFLLLQKDINEMSGLYQVVVSEVEKVLILKILKATRQNKNQTAKILGISRNTLSKKIKKFEIGD
jgi:Fis family transcriptional regulator